MRGLRSLSDATGRKIRGHLRKTFPSCTSPLSPHPCQKLPDILQGTVHGKKAGTPKREGKKSYKENYFYSKRPGYYQGLFPH